MALATNIASRPGDRAGARHQLPSWASRHNTILTAVAAGVTPVLYLVFVYHYAVNSFDSDDWSVAPLVHAALHGQPTLGLLWGQHHESRLFIGNVIDVTFGFVDRLDLRSVMLFSAVVLIASYAILLLLFRRYIGRRLTPFPVLVLGVTWFSLADVQNALWAFQVSWYLAVFFFLLMLCVLLVPHGRRRLWFTLAVVVAIAGSLSTVQGFLCWPLGAICILWPTRSSRWRPEIAAWLGAMVVTLALYLVGYSFDAGNTCRIQSQCTPSAELHHPLTSLGFFFALIGNVIPGQTSGIVPSVEDGARFVLLGVVILAVAAFILAASWRHRSSTERLPLPALVIVFSLLFDVTIALGRGGSGVAGAVNANRFVMANLVLLAGVVMYGLARVPTRGLSVTGGRWKAYGTYLALLALAAFVVVQLTASTGFGFATARTTSVQRKIQTIVFVSFIADYPSPRQGVSAACREQLTFLLAVPEVMVRDAAEDQLGEFQPASYRRYLPLAIPKSHLACRKQSA